MRKVGLKPPLYQMLIRESSAFSILARDPQFANLGLALLALVGELRSGIEEAGVPNISWTATVRETSPRRIPKVVAGGPEKEEDTGERVDRGEVDGKRWCIVACGCIGGRWLGLMDMSRK